MAQARPPLPEGRRPFEQQPVAAGVHAAMRRAAGERNGGERDHMWEVMHARDKSGSPTPRPLPAAGARAVSEVQGAGDRRKDDRGGGSPVAPQAPPPPAFEAHGGEWTPRARLPRRLPQVGWEMPNAALPDPSEFKLERYDMQAGGGLLKPDLRHKILGLEAASADAQGWLERRLETSQADQRADLARRWSTFEQADRRFKEWVQREHEEMTGQVQQVKVSTMDGQNQQQRQSTTLANQCQRIEMRLQEVEAMVTQADAKANGLAHAVQVSGAVAGSAGGAATHAVQGEIDALRVDLDREAQARAGQSAESTERMKELHGLIAQVNERQEHEAYGRQQQLAEQSERGQARVAALEPNFDALRSEIDVLKQQLLRTGGDCARRCEEVESSCLQKVSGVREAALNAARELWEEHNGVLTECKASMASLQQILDTKDKIAAQLQNLTQQAMHDDKEGLLRRLLQGDDALRNRLSEVEAALAGEQGARLEAQHASGAHASRMGVALEQAQAAWVKDSDRATGELREMRRQVDRGMNSEARGWERRLAEAVDSLQRRIDDLEGKAHSVKAGTTTVEDRVAELVRSQDSALGEAEGRLKRQVEDVQAMQAGKLAQCDFDFRAALRAAFTEHAERARAELARVEEGAAVERGLLRTSLEDIGREAEVRFARLREDFERRLAASEDSVSRRSVQASEISTQLRRELTEYHSEARAYADRVGQDARATAEVALAAFVEDMARQAAKADRTTGDIAREIASVEARLSDSITVVETKASKCFQDGLRLEREHLQSEVERLLEEERSHRMQAETERLASLQKRLGAHEELTTRRLDDLKIRQDDAFATHRQCIDALLVQDRKEVTTKIEELARDQRGAAALTKTDIQRLDVICEKLAADMGEGLEQLTIVTEQGRAKLEDQMQRELAGFGAKLSVCMTTASAELRLGLKAADERTDNGLAIASEKLSSGLAATVAAAEAGNKSLQETIEASISGVGAGLAAHALESAAARASIRTDLSRAQTELNQNLQELGAACQAFDTELDTRVKALEEVSQELGTALVKQGAELGTALEKQGVDFTANLAAAVSEAAEGRRQTKEALEASQQASGERFQSQEISIDKSKNRLDELEAQLATSQTEAQAALSATREELSGNMEGAVKALEERLSGQMSEEKERGLALVQRLDTLDDTLKSHDERGQAAEAELAKRIQELEKTSEEQFNALQKRSDDADEALKGQLGELRHEHDSALGAELTRAIAAEEL